MFDIFTLKSITIFCSSGCFSRTKRRPFSEVIISPLTDWQRIQTISISSLKDHNQDWTLTSKAGGESQPKHGSNVSFQRIVQNALLQTQHGLVDKPGNESVLYIRVWWAENRYTSENRMFQLLEMLKLNNKILYNIKDSKDLFCVSKTILVLISNNWDNFSKLTACTFRLALIIVILLIDKWIMWLK